MSKIFLILILNILIIKSYCSRLPIRITEQPESQIVLKNSKVTLKCSYEIEHPILETNTKVTWLFSPFSDDQTNKPVENEQGFIIEKSRLIIESFDHVIHTGQYRCLINSTLIILSEPANLTLAKIDPFEVSNSDSSFINLSEGNVAIIPCKLPFSNPSAIPLFYFNDQLITASYIFTSNSLQDTNRFKIFPSGNLQISNVKPSDSGTYRCSARNPITNEIKQNSKQTVLKVYEPFGTKLPEIVYVPVDTNRVKIGSNLTLECVANGAPVPLVSWEKFGGILPEKRSLQIFGNLILINVQPEDKGTYVCRAENGPGQATFKTAMIDVFESPSLIQNSELVFNIKKGDSIDLKCPIRSRPRADINWFLNGKLLSSTGPYHRISSIGDKSILTVKNLDLSSIYQCYAQNEYGSYQADLFVSSNDGNLIKNRQLIGSNLINNNEQDVPKKPIIIMGPQNTTIYEGQSVVLLCVTSEASSGNTQINWLQNDLIIEPTLMRRFEINQLLGNLRIVSVQKSDAGIYKCIASNEFGMSTAEAYVNVISSSNKNVDGLNMKLDSNRFKEETSKKLLSPSSSRPIIQQIGPDKILLKWNLVDSQNNLIDSSINSYNIAYFKVEYKTNKQQIPGVQPNTWLTIDEQIDSKKREYILTDLNKFEIYRFRITTFFQNGELNHSHQSSKFKLEPTWISLEQKVEKETSSSSSSQLQTSEFKLSQIQVQITQIWAISSSSLGLKWDVNIKNNSLLNKKINGFYIYYRKLISKSDQVNNVDDNQNIEQVPLYNYTRINLPISIIETSTDQNSFSNQNLIDTYIIANLDQSSQYEIKMTCYNLNGDLCSFSNPILGLTLLQTTTSTHSILSVNNQKISTYPQNVVLLKSKQNEVLFMILGVVLGVLTLLLVIFIAMCLVRQRQHKKLLAQLHNNSHKLTSSSCPTLIYEDSLRQNNRLNQNQNQNYTGNLFIPSSNDSNSTNSQSMSTTTSSMTTPQTNSENSTVQPSHILLLNGNTVSTASIGYANANLSQPPPIPQVPPPSMINNNANATLNRININMNPLNGYLERGTLSPNKLNANTNQENFYHTLTQLGTLPNQMESSEYNNATLNMRNLLIQQQQQQQLIMNTLKNMNFKQQFNANEVNKDSVRSPTMRRNSSLSSSKKSKKVKNKQQQQSIETNNLINEQSQIPIQLQQPTNYYLLPNCIPQQATLLNRNIYNEVDLLALEAAIINQNIANGNLFLLNQQTQIYPTQLSSFIPTQQIISPAQNNLMDLNDQVEFGLNKILNEGSNAIYEPTEVENMNTEQEPMLSNHHYATSELSCKQETTKDVVDGEEEHKLL